MEFAEIKSRVQEALLPVIEKRRGAEVGRALGVERDKVHNLARKGIGNVDFVLQAGRWLEKNGFLENASYLYSSREDSVQEIIVLMNQLATLMKDSEISVDNRIRLLRANITALNEVLEELEQD